MHVDLHLFGCYVCGLTNWPLGDLNEGLDVYFQANYRLFHDTSLDKSEHKILTYKDTIDNIGQLKHA